MVKMDFNFAIFVTAFLCFHIGLASAIKIKITTDRYNGVVPTSFDVTCTLDPEKSGHSRTKRIVAIKVSRHGERPLAVLHRNSDIFYDQLLTANIKAKGRIDKDPRNTNMTVTFTNAMKEDSGVYNCSLLYWDQWGFIQREEASTNVTIENNNAHDVIRYFIGELKSMKKKNDKLENQLAELDTKTTTQDEKDDYIKSTLMFLVEKVSTLETELSTEKNESRAKEIQHQDEVSSLTHQVKSQEKQLQQQKQTQMDESRALTNQVSSLTHQMKSHEKLLQQLEQKDNLTVMFTAVYNTPSVHLTTGQDLVFGDVIHNKGQAYDGNTGTFTAPVAGYYMLHLSVFINRSEVIYVDLQSGNGKRLKTVRAGDESWFDYSDGSCVARLEAGEKVKPVVKLVDSSGFLLVDNNQGSFSYNINTFSGYLLKMF